MDNRVLLPPQIQEDIPGQVIFLAGPIQGAPDWQGEAIRILGARASDIFIASPRRKYLDGDFDYGKQVDWETYYLRRASVRGVILFWLAKEAVHDCGRAYAQTTRFELAEWKVRHERDGVKVAVGIEEGFPGAKYVRKRLAQDCPKIPLCDSLEGVCSAAIALSL
jgi:hypothetical protein